MSEETRRDIVLIVIFSLVLAIGMASVFLGCRFLAWIVIAISDLYLSIVLLLPALRSDDDGFLDKHSWVTRFFPRKTAGILVVALLFLSVLSGFAGLYVGVEVFSSAKTPLDPLHQLFHLGFYRLLAEAWLWSACGGRSAGQWSSVAGCTFSHPHLTNFHFQKPMNAS
jgi:hypothetical protein